MTAEALGASTGGEIVSLRTIEDANKTIGIMDSALKLVNKQRADLGEYQNRMEHAVHGIDVAAENMQAAESRLRDVGMAKDMVEYPNNSI